MENVRGPHCLRTCCERSDSPCQIVWTLCVRSMQMWREGEQMRLNWSTPIWRPSNWLVFQQPQGIRGSTVYQGWIKGGSESFRGRCEYRYRLMAWNPPAHIYNEVLCWLNFKLNAKFRCLHFYPVSPASQLRNIGNNVAEYKQAAAYMVKYYTVYR